MEVPCYMGAMCASGMWCWLPKAWINIDIPWYSQGYDYLFMPHIPSSACTHHHVMIDCYEKTLKYPPFMNESISIFDSLNFDVYMFLHISSGASHNLQYSLDCSCPIGVIIHFDSRLVPSQWETLLLCNDVSHWLGANLESALKISSNLMLTYGNQSL